MSGSKFVEFCEQQDLPFEDMVGELLMSMATLAMSMAEKAGTSLADANMEYRLVIKGRAFAISVTEMEGGMKEVMAEAMKGVTVQ